MDLHEYQAKELFREAGMAVNPGEVTADAGHARELAEQYGGSAVVKAQVHSGGRGKAGGVKLARTPDEAAAHASAILGMEINGLVVEQVLVSPLEDIASEAYVGVLVDPRRAVSGVHGLGRGRCRHRGGRRHPTRRPSIGCASTRATGSFPTRRTGWPPGFTRIRAWSVRRRASSPGSTTSSWPTAPPWPRSTPLISTAEGRVVAIDAKMSIDDNELFRRRAVAAMRDTASEASADTRAREAGLSFVKLDGSVGCCVNGAGLAMATMDLVKYYGGEPANFLDIGGSSNPDKVVAALEIITLRPPA